MSILVGPVILSATGGTISAITGYTVHTFSSPGAATFTPSQNGNIEVLVVGGGGITDNGGGGGGAVFYKKLVSVTSGTPYPITVGSVGSPGGQGGISSCTFNNATIIAYGGGAGGLNSGFPSPNASGGGAGSGSGGGGGTGANVTGLGFPGGSSPSISKGGGGGAGGPGGPAESGSMGGIGVSYNTTGTSQYYGAGAGGFGSPNGGLPGASYGTGNTPGAVIIRYPV